MWGGGKRTRATESGIGNNRLEGLIQDLGHSELSLQQC